LEEIIRKEIEPEKRTSEKANLTIKNEQRNKRVFFVTSPFWLLFGLAKSNIYSE